MAVCFIKATSQLCSYDRVLIHTDDVPSNYLEAFGKNDLWQLRKVQYIDGVSDLYIRKGNIFDGVFTKLAVWTLDDYAKVILLDLDVIPLKPLDNLFELPCPAAMVRGQGEFNHGDKVDGDRFFGAENYHDYMGAVGGDQCRPHFGERVIHSERAANLVMDEMPFVQTLDPMAPPKFWVTDGVR